MTPTLHSLRLRASIFLVALGGIGVLPAFCGADLCEPVTIHTEMPDTLRPVVAYSGRSIGQTFWASETLLTAVVVWTPEPDSNATRMRLFVTEVDEKWPYMQPTLLEGPILTAPRGDGIHPTRVEFRIEPPLALPRRGLYFFAIKDYCCCGIFTLVKDSSDPYPDGSLWTTREDGFCNGVNYDPTERVGEDLVFDVEFCGLATAAQQGTWGSVKTRYR